MCHFLKCLLFYLYRGKERVFLMYFQKKHAQVYLITLSSVEASVASGIAFSIRCIYFS